MSGALNQAPQSIINVFSVAGVFIRQKYNQVFDINKIGGVDKISVAVTKEELFEKGPVVIKMEEYLKAAARWPVSFVMGMEGCCMQLAKGGARNKINQQLYTWQVSWSSLCEFSGSTHPPPPPKELASSRLQSNI